MFRDDLYQGANATIQAEALLRWVSISKEVCLFAAMYCLPTGCCDASLAELCKQTQRPTHTPPTGLRMAEIHFRLGRAAFVFS